MSYVKLIFILSSDLGIREFLFFIILCKDNIIFDKSTNQNQKIGFLKNWPIKKRFKRWDCNDI